MSTTGRWEGEKGPEGAFRSEKYGFEVSIPEGWVSEGEHTYPAWEYTLFSFCKEGGRQYGDVNVFYVRVEKESIPGLTLEKYTTEMYYLGNIIDPVTVGGQQGLEFIQIFENQVPGISVIRRSVATVHGGRGYQLSILTWQENWNEVKPALEEWIRGRGYEFTLPAWMENWDEIKPVFEEFVRCFKFI